MNNYYTIIGVKATATSDEIKKSYRELAKKFHPDKNPNNKEAEEKFKAIAEAYEHLSNEDKRSAFDLKLQQEEQRLRQEKVNSQRAAYSVNLINWEHVVTLIVLVVLVIVGLASFASNSNRGKR